MNPAYFSTRFHSSAQSWQRCPEALAEVAFAGRSNAGKSSAINTLTRHGKLARTSKTPGRTQLINHFLIDEERFLVDLPGYGYAQVSREQKNRWQRAMAEYLLKREPLKGLVLVMDIRHPLTDTDWQLIELMPHDSVGLHLLLTKADKISRNQRRSVLMRVQAELETAGLAATLQDFSALKSEGVDDVHAVLDAWLFGKPLPEG